MRVFLIALMILMLPVRGWMGDAMAISMMNMQIGSGAQSHVMPMQNMAHDMAPQPPQDMPQAAAQASEHGDCAGMSMLAVASPDPSSQTQGSMAACESCSLCQACSSAVMGVDALRAATLSMPQASPSDALAHFASAHPQRGQKPPIS